MKGSDSEGGRQGERMIKSFKATLAIDWFCFWKERELVELCLKSEGMKATRGVVEC